MGNDGYAVPLDYDEYGKLSEVINGCSSLLELRLDWFITDEDLAAVASSCPRLRLFHCYASDEEDMFTEDALIKMLAALPTLKDLFIQHPPYHMCEFWEQYWIKR